MLAKVERFRIVGPYRLSITFSDGSGGEHDFLPLVENGKNLLAELSDPKLFGRVFVDFGALTWPNGFDISPEWLRREMLAAGELQPAMAAE